MCGMLLAFLLSKLEVMLLKERGDSPSTCICTGSRVLFIVQFKLPTFSSLTLELRFLGVSDGGDQQDAGGEGEGDVQKE